MRTHPAAALLAAALCLTAVSPSRGVPAAGVVVVRGSTYVPGDVSFPEPTLVLAQGSSLLLQNADLVAHSVQSDGRDATGARLFDSGDPVYAKDGPDQVVGVAALPPGSYGFRCAIHYDMQGTLVIV